MWAKEKSVKSTNKEGGKEDGSNRKRIPEGSWRQAQENKEEKSPSAHFRPRGGGGGEGDTTNRNGDQDTAESRHHWLDNGLHGERNRVREEKIHHGNERGENNP